MTTVLVVAAHPDDEILGCGGTVARHTADGDDVHVLILGEGARARARTRDANARALDLETDALRAAAIAAAEILGTHPPRFGHLPDNRMDSLDLLDVVHEVEEVIGSVGPSLVYTHHGGDLNIDHQVVHRAVLTACRPLPSARVRRVYTFETLSSTEWTPAAVSAPFAPQRFHDIAPHLGTKLEALSKYESEMRDAPHPRSLKAVEALAAYRGHSVGLMAAEAFEVVRELID